MKVLIKKVDVVKGVNAKGEPYLFSNVLVVFDEKTADYVTVDSSVCHPDKIKPGMKAEIFCPFGNMKRASIFEPNISNNQSSDVKNSEDFNGFDVDTSTGEVKDKNKK